MAGTGWAHVAQATTAASCAARQMQLAAHLCNPCRQREPDAQVVPQLLQPGVQSSLIAAGVLVVTQPWRHHLACSQCS